MQRNINKTLGLWVAAILITAFIAGLLMLNAHFEMLAGAKRIGVRLDDPGGVVKVLDVTSGLPADRAGIRTGDNIVRMGDVAVATLSDYERVMQNFAAGGRVEFTIRRGGEVLTLQIEPGADFPWARYASVFGPVLTFLALGLLCLLYWRQDYRARLLAVLVIAIAAELALPVLIIGHPVLLQVSTAVFFLLTGVQIAVEFHLISLIPARAPWIVRWPGLITLFYAAGLGFGAGTAIAILLGVLIPGQSIAPVTDLGFDSLSIILPVWAVVIGAMLVYQMMNYPSPRGRQQTGLVLVGVTPWIVMTLLETAVLLNHGLLPEWWFTVTNWSLIIFPVAVFVAIFRHRLFDLELVVRRSLVFGTFTVLLVGGMYAVLAAAWPMVDAVLGDTLTPWVITGAALMLGIFGNRARASLERTIELRVFPERLALRRHLIRLASSLPVRGKLPLMGSYLADELCLAFRARSSVIVLVDARTQLPYSLASARMDGQSANRVAAAFRNDPRLEQLLTKRERAIVLSRLPENYQFVQTLSGLGITVIVPLVSHDSFIGAMCLGHKHTNVAYPGEELQLFNLLSHHVTSAFENARLADNATYDNLTGLYRREIILDILERECTRAIQCHEPIAVAMIDIDRFKATNDNHGHLAGDRILRKVAQTIRTELRSTDAVGRYGGEEFLAVLSNTAVKGAANAVEHVRTGIDALRIRLDNGVVAGASVSIGLAGLDEATGDAEALARSMIETADRYLYEAKQNGRNQVIAKHASLGAA